MHQPILLTFRILLSSFLARLLPSGHSASTRDTEETFFFQARVGQTGSTKGGPAAWSRKTNPWRWWSGILRDLDNLPQNDSGGRADDQLCQQAARRPSLY